MADSNALGRRLRLAGDLADSAGARLLSTSSILMGARLVGAGLGLVVQILLARTLAAEGLGFYYIGLSVMSLGAVFGAMGYPDLGKRFIPRYGGRAGPSLNAFMASALHDTFWVSLGLMAVVQLAALLGIDRPALTQTLLVAALGIPAMAVVRLGGAFSSVQKQFYASSLPELAVRPLLMLAALVLLRPFAADLPVVVYVGLQVFLTVLFALFLARKSGLLAAHRQQAQQRSQERLRHLSRHWRGLALMTAALPVFTLLIADLDIVLLAPLLAPEAIGQAGVVLKIAALCAFGVQVMQQVALPDLARSAQRRRLLDQRGMLLTLNLGAFAFVAAASLGTALFGEHLLALFGPEFVGAKWPLVIVIASYAGRAALGPAVQLLIAVGAERQALRTGLMTVLILIAANVVLVQTHGVVGAALAFALANLASAGLATAALNRHAGLDVGLPALVFKRAQR